MLLRSAMHRCDCSLHCLSLSLSIEHIKPRTRGARQRHSRGHPVLCLLSAAVRVPIFRWCSRRVTAYCRSWTLPQGNGTHHRICKVMRRLLGTGPSFTRGVVRPNWGLITRHVMTPHMMRNMLTRNHTGSAAAVYPIGCGLRSRRAAASSGAPSTPFHYCELTCKRRESCLSLLRADVQAAGAAGTHHARAALWPAGACDMRLRSPDQQ